MPDPTPARPSKGAKLHASPNPGKPNKYRHLEKAAPSTQKLDIPVEKKVDKKPEPKKTPANITRYVDSVRARHKSLPGGVLEAIGKAPSKGQAKAILKEHLRKTSVLA